ncbi:MAG: inner membrane CreD family protein, partial [Saezia sp.]
MGEKLIGKIIAITILAIFLFIAAIMIKSTVHERQEYQREVVESIAASVSGSQRILGPVLVVPYKVSVNVRDPETKELSRMIQERSYYMLPQDLSVTGDVTVTPRKLGIYQTQLYSGKFNLNGSFGKINLEAVQDIRGFVAFGEPYFVLSVGDTRGINGVSTFIFNYKPFEFKEGILDSGLGKGMHVPVSV